jgi:hypothetical protein
MTGRMSSGADQLAPRTPRDAWTPSKVRSVVVRTHDRRESDAELLGLLLALNTAAGHSA